MDAVLEKAFRHRHAPMIGRTHGVHAEPMTFGLKMALWHAELQRQLARLDRARATIAVGKLSGAVGTFSHLSPDVEEEVCAPAGSAARAHLLADPPARPSRRGDDDPRPDRRQASRSSRPRSGPCRRPRCGSWRSPSGPGRRARRPCPTSATPWAASRCAGLARLVRSNAAAALENIALWHERDISHSSVERVIIPDSFLALDHMLHRFTRIVRGTDRGRGADAAEPRPRPGPRVLGPAPPRAHRPGDATGGRLPGGAGPRHGGLEARPETSGSWSTAIPRSGRS